MARVIGLKKGKKMFELWRKPIVSDLEPYKNLSQINNHLFLMNNLEFWGKRPKTANAIFHGELLRKKGIFVAGCDSDVTVTSV